MPQAQPDIIKRFNKDEKVGLEDALDNKAFNELVKNPRPNSRRKFDSSSLYIPLLLNGQKPGLTTSFDCETVEEVNRISDLFSCLNLSHKISFKRIHDVAVFYVSPNLQLIKNIEVREEDETFGAFLGVPEKDNKWYDEYGGAEQISEFIPITKHAEYNPDTIQYARLVSWVCRPSKQGLNRTIQIGKNWYNTAEYLNGKGFKNPLKWADKEVSRTEHSWYPDQND